MARSALSSADAPQVIRFSEILESPWINGGGSVRVIATGHGNTNNEWGWRLSIADVGQSGEFSRLPGVDRVLTVVDGGPLQLNINGTDHEVSAFQPFMFDGGAVTTAALSHGPVRNLNLMCRIGHIEGRISVVPLEGQARIQGHAIILLSGSAETAGTELLQFDTLVAPGEASFDVSGTGALAVLTLR